MAETLSENIIRVQCPKEHYTAEACIVWCFDARFSEAYDEFLKQRGFSEYAIDLVKRAGGAKALAMDASSEQEDVRKQIRGSIDLHHANRVILMMHMDCGAYGGSKNFNNDHQEEWDHHSAELGKAARFVQATFTEIKYIECWIADFDGLHRIDGVEMSAE
jgi:hypothetical protein